GAAAAGARGARGAAAAGRGQATQGAAPNEAPVAGVQGYFHDSMIMKFTQDGKFLMQIGKPGGSKGSNDVENLRLPAKIFVDKKRMKSMLPTGTGTNGGIVLTRIQGNSNANGAPTAKCRTTRRLALTIPMLRPPSNSEILYIARNCPMMILSTYAIVRMT